MENPIVRRITVGYSLLVILLLSACSQKLQLNRSEKTLYPVSNDMPQDSAVLAYYRPYKQKLDSQMNEIVAVSAAEIVKGKPEGPLNNLMADAMYQVAKQNNIKFDVAYTNYGGLRISLPKGNIPLYKVFELMPFENLFTTVSFSGADMQRFFNYVAAEGGDPISGATFKIKDKKATDIKINGEALDPAKEYTILTSDYMANGGDGGIIFNETNKKTTHQIKLRDALISYLQQQHKAGKIINPVKDGRITME